MHSVSRKRKALETAQLGAHQASRGHRLLLQLWGTSRKGAPDSSPFLVQSLWYMLASSPASNLVTVGLYRKPDWFAEPNKNESLCTYIYI